MALSFKQDPVTKHWIAQYSQKEKSITEMNNAELKQYAAKHNIDLTGLKKRSDVIAKLTGEDILS